MKPARRPKNGPPAKGKAPHSAQLGEVLTLTEAATYLRITKEDLLRLVRDQGLPGRVIGNDWRFLKAALQAWLGAPPARRGLLSQIGALKDDPYREEMLRDIYARRGRPETEEP
jgi:excisionase family DNA binding protein